MPKRVQRTRAKGGGMPEGAKYVGRPGIFGNPFDHKTLGHQTAVIMFGDWLKGTHSKHKDPFRRKQVLERLPELKGKDLACWCGEKQMCHADVLLEMANQ
jgi:hypothetical protein